MDTTIYRIPVQNFLRLEGEIKKMNRRAEKLGCPPVKLTVLRTVTEKRKDEALGFEYDFHINECTVEGEAPKLSDWTLVAAVEPVNNGEMLVREVPGQTCPAQYRTTDLRCDHCNMIRRRNAIYVLRHPDHDHKQVGRNCLKDFLGGVSPDALLSKAEYLLDFAKLAKDAEDTGWGYGGRVERVVPVNQFVSTVAVIARKIGYVSKSAAYQQRDEGGGPEATASIAWRVCTQPNDERTKRFIAEKGIAVEDGDVAKAEAAVKWAETIGTDTPATSTYMHDLGVCCRQTYVTWKTSGYVSSVLGAHQRHLGEQLAKSAPAKVEHGGHLGEVDQRLVFDDVQITEAVPYNGGMYPKTKVKFTTPANNILIWWASGSPAWVEVGKKLSIKGTVKKHDDYKGVPQTVLERVLPHGEEKAA